MVSELPLHSVHAQAASWDVLARKRLTCSPRFPSQVVEPSGLQTGCLPAALYRLLDPTANVDLPTAQRVRQTLPGVVMYTDSPGLGFGQGASLTSCRVARDMRVHRKSLT